MYRRRGRHSTTFIRVSSLSSDLLQSLARRTTLPAYLPDAK
jgi:hypothetical protein